MSKDDLPLKATAYHLVFGEGSAGKMIMVFILVITAGCALPIKKEDIMAQAQQIKAAIVIPEAPENVKENVPAESPFARQEKIVYKAKYLGIHIGEFIAVNKGKTTMNGRPAYCFELTVQTLPFFGIVKDRYVSYMDATKLVVLRHEEYVKKGQRLESTVDFDDEKGIAFYKNVITGQEKQVAIPAKIQDIVTGGFYLRAVPLELGDTAELNVYADEKIYNYIGLLHSKASINLTGQGSQETLLLKSYVFHDGKPIQNMSAEVFFTMTTYRTPLRAVLKTFFGNVAVVLSEEK